MRPNHRIGVPVSAQLTPDVRRLDYGQWLSILSALSSAMSTTTAPVSFATATALSDTLTSSDSATSTVTVTASDPPSSTTGLSKDSEIDEITTVVILTTVMAPDTSSPSSAAVRLATDKVVVPFASNRLGLTLPTASAILGPRAEVITTVTIPAPDSATTTGTVALSGPVVVDPTFVEFSTGTATVITTTIGPTTTVGAVIDSRPGVGFTVIDGLSGTDFTQQISGSIFTMITGGTGVSTVTGLAADPAVVTIAPANPSVITVTPAPPGPSVMTILPAPGDPVVLTLSPAQPEPSLLTILPAPAAPSVVTILSAPAAPIVVTTSFVLATSTTSFQLVFDSITPLATTTVTVQVTAMPSDGYICMPSSIDSLTETSLGHKLAPGAAVLLFAMVGVILLW